MPPAHCPQCSSVFSSTRALHIHYNRRHYHPRPRTPRTTFRKHPHLNGTSQYMFLIGFQTNSLYAIARPCDTSGTYLPPDCDPLEDTTPPSYAPFDNREMFEFAELMYCKAEMSEGNTNSLLDILRRHSTAGGATFFESTQDMYQTIDSIQHGDAPWKSFFFKYGGVVDANSPAWKTARYELITRDSRVVVTNMLQNKEFDGKFDYIPYQEYESRESVRYQNGMSGQWAYRIAVSSLSHYRKTFTTYLLQT